MLSNFLYKQIGVISFGYNNYCSVFTKATNTFKKYWSTCLMYIILLRSQHMTFSVGCHMIKSFYLLLFHALLSCFFHHNKAVYTNLTDTLFAALHSTKPSSFFNDVKLETIHPDWNTHCTLLRAFIISDVIISFIFSIFAAHICTPTSKNMLSLFFYSWIYKCIFVVFNFQQAFMLT